MLIKLNNCSGAALYPKRPLAQVPAPRAENSSLVSIPQQKHQCFMESLQEPPVAPWHWPCTVGKLPSSRHLHKFRSNSAPWLLKTKSKTTIINYSMQGPRGNLKTSSQGQGLSGNRSLLTRGRPSLSWWLHLQDNCTMCIFSMSEKPTGTRGADWQHTEGLTLNSMTELNPNKVYDIESEGKRNQFWFPWVGFHHLIRERNESLKHTYTKGIFHFHERWGWLHPKLMKSNLLCLFEDFIYLNYANIKYSFIL